MQFQVPQFIEVEDKIFGPLTFRQFIFLFGGAGGAYIFYRLFPIYIAVPLVIGVAGLAASLAFFQLNGRPFIVGMENAFYFMLHSKLYLWNNANKTSKAVALKKVSNTSTQIYVPKISDSKLHELAWSLDIRERVAAGTTDDDERVPATGVRLFETARDALPSSREANVR